MDGLIGKLRAFAFDTKGQGGVGREGPFGFPGESPKACFQCDVDLGGKAWVQCSICGYVFCRQCCAAEKGGGVDGTAAWPEGGARPACDFCRHLRLGYLTQQSLDANGDMPTGPKVAPSPYSLSRLSSGVGAPAAWQRQTCSFLHHMSRSGNTVHRQVVGDLTWEVPMELEPEYGLSPEDQQTKRMRRSNPGSKGAAAASAVATASGNKAAGGTTPAPQVAQLTGQLLPGQHQQHGQEPLSLKPGSSSTYEEHRAGAPSSTWGVLHSLGTAGEAPPQPTSLLGLQRQLLGAAATHHLQRLVGQLLEAEGVADPGAWVGVLTRLACDAAALVLPPAMVNNGVLDPRHYIKVKKLADIGRPSDSSVLPAVVCKRNVAHRRMRTHLHWPKVVLLGGALEHQRSEERLSSIETLIEQEPDQLRSAVRYIASLGTELLVVEKSVARAAQEELLARGMTLVLNVKAELMERLARCMGIRVAPSVEDLNASHVGTCREFHVDPLSAHATASGPGAPAAARTTSPTSGAFDGALPALGGGVVLPREGTGAGLPAGGAVHGNDAGRGPGATLLRTVPPSVVAAPLAVGSSSGAAAGAAAPSPPAPPPTTTTRTLMCFGCAVPLGATLLLKGGDVDTLGRVKRVARFAVLAAFAARLECAFLAEELVAALAACRGEVPASAAHGGLASFRAVSAAIIEASVRNAATSMPNGVALALTPHLSVWDHSLACECDEAVWTAAAMATAAKPALGNTHQPGSYQLGSHQQGGAAAEAQSIGGGGNSDGTKASRPVRAADGAEAGSTAAAEQEALSASWAAASKAASSPPIGSGSAGANAGAAPSTAVGMPGPAGASECAAAEREALQGVGVGSGAPIDGAAAEGTLQHAGAQGFNAAGDKAQAQLAAFLKLKVLQGLQVYDYQRIQISMSCRNPKKQLLCEPHCIKRIDFYAPTDMSLLQFILAASPSPYKRCTMMNCSDGVTAHVRSFLHGSARITISIATVAASEALPNEDKQQVWMWLRPKGKGAAARFDVRRIPLSAESACMSLGHFLQLTFTADALDVGGRCLHHDFVRYFGLGRSVICMYQDRITPYTVLMPKLACVYGLPAQLKWLRQEAIELEEEVAEAFSQIEGALHHQPKLLLQHAPPPTITAANGDLANGGVDGDADVRAAKGEDKCVVPSQQQQQKPQEQQQQQQQQQQQEGGQEQLPWGPDMFGNVGAGQQQQAKIAAGVPKEPLPPQPPQQQQQQQQQSQQAKVAASVPKEPEPPQLQQLRKRAGLKALQQVIDQDKASFITRVSACLQRPFSHPAVQDSLQQPMAPLPLHGEASSQHPSRTGGTLSAQGGAAAASTAQQQVEDGSLVGLGRTTSMAAGAAAPDRGGSGEGDGGGGAAAAAAVADTQGCAAGGTTTGGTAVTQLSKQQTAADSPEQQQQQQQGITLQLGSPVPNSCSNFMGTAREGSDLADDVSQKEAGGAEGELKGDTGALHLKGGGDDEECTQAQKGALREDGVNGQPSTNGQAGPNGQASAEEFRGCGEEVAGGAGAGREAGAAEGRQEKQEANWVTQTPPHDQQQQQLQQHPFPGGLGCSVTEGREGASDAWESEVAASMCDLNQLRRSLAVTLLSWAANLQDPDCFASMCMQAQSLQTRDKAGADAAAPPSLPLVNPAAGSVGMGGGQGAGGAMEGTLALMQQLEAESASAGLLPVPIIASSAGPISIPDVASLAVGAARAGQAASPNPIAAASATGADLRGTEGGGICAKEGVEQQLQQQQQQQEMAPQGNRGEATDVSTGQGEGETQHLGRGGDQAQLLVLQQQQQQQQQEMVPQSNGGVATLASTGQGGGDAEHHQGQGSDQAQLQQQEQQQQQQQEEQEDPEDDDDESYKCYGDLHAPLADGGMAGDEDDDDAFFPQCLPSCTEEEQSTSIPPPSGQPAPGASDTGAAAADPAADLAAAAAAAAAAAGLGASNNNNNKTAAGTDIRIGSGATSTAAAAAAAAAAGRGPPAPGDASAAAEGAPFDSVLPVLGASDTDSSGGQTTHVTSDALARGRAEEASAVGADAQESGLPTIAAGAHSTASEKASLSSTLASPPRSHTMSKSAQEASPFSALAAAPQSPAPTDASARKAGSGGPNQGPQSPWTLSKGNQADNKPLMNLGGNAPIIGRLSMPGRTLLPPGIGDVVVPIHDCEPSSIIAHCLASRPYHLLLNAAIKNMLLELRRGGRGGSSQESSHPYPTQSSTQTASGREGASSVSGAGPQIASAQPVQQAVSAPAVAANTTAAASQLQQQQQQQQQGLWPAASQSPAVHQERLPPTQPVPASLSTMSVPSKGQAAISGSSSTSTSSSNGSIPAPPSGPPCVQENNGSNCNKAADLPSSLLLSPSKAATAANGSAPSVPLSSSTTTTTNHTSASAPADDVRAAPANAVRTGAGADASLAEDVGEGGVRAQQQQQQQQQAAVKHAQNGVNKDGFGSGRGGVLGGGGGGLRLNDLDWLSVMLSHEPVHLRHGFEDEGLGMPWTRAKFQVVCFFAPQFAELRRRVVQGGEMSYVTSLSRCVRWAQRGGKSNAYFAKTRDDRYIIKSMSKAEKASFLEFAPAYFEHAAKSALSGQRTCLAKVLGMYQVTAKTPTGASGLAATNAGKDGVLDLLVMENCFYDQQISRIYDLKGSERNRFNADAAANPHDAKEVHLDENLRRANLSAPLMVTPASQRQLELALWADTAFLSGLAIMDYSLLVGVDKDDHVLAVAIIDFIRQYTWDKQLETWVKGSGILGGGGKEPTIISPKQYMRRFRTAIMSYFTVVPGSAFVSPSLPSDM